MCNEFQKVLVTCKQCPYSIWQYASTSRPTCSTRQVTRFSQNVRPPGPAGNVDHPPNQLGPERRRDLDGRMRIAHKRTTQTAEQRLEQLGKDIDMVWFQNTKLFG